MSLSVENLCFTYTGGANVLQNVSFTAKSGEIIAVLGPNGAGKSTLFRCMLGSLTHYTGRITMDDTDLKTLSEKEKARHIAYIPQSHRPTAGYTVLDTALMGLTRQLGTFSQPKKAHEALAMSALEKLGIAHLAQRDFSCLSGGERQMTLIARAMTQQADVLVLDEPTASLDYGNQILVLGLMKKLAQQGYAVIFSTHNPQHALFFADRILALCGGKMAAFGAAQSVLTPELLTQLYGVKTTFVESEAGTVILPKVEER